MKFSIGDKVKLIKQPEGAFENMVGLVGAIIDIDDEWHFPYEVEWEDGEHHDGICLFAGEDLELVKETVLMMPEITLSKPTYINIKWQEGTVDESDINGATIEDIIDLLVERLEGFQSGKFTCRENALAITKLEEARMWLNERTRKRREQGIEGKDEKHV